MDAKLKLKQALLNAIKESNGPYNRALGKNDWERGYHQMRIAYNMLEQRVAGIVDMMEEEKVGKHPQG